jgi:hypothetical protein
LLLQRKIKARLWKKNVTLLFLGRKHERIYFPFLSVPVIAQLTTSQRQQLFVVNFVVGVLLLLLVVMR